MFGTHCVARSDSTKLTVIAELLQRWMAQIAMSGCPVGAHHCLTADSVGAHHRLTAGSVGAHHRLTAGSARLARLTHHLPLSAAPQPTPGLVLLLS